MINGLLNKHEIKELKIPKSVWERMKSGDMEWFFELLKNGLESGTYKFVSEETKTKEVSWCPICESSLQVCSHYESHIYNHDEKWIEVPKEVFGTATLEPKILSPKLELCCDRTIGECGCNTPAQQKYQMSINMWGDWEVFDIIDKQSHKWVKENFIDKNKEFIAYKISNVKEK